MKYTYYGHSCFLVEVNGVKLLFDPFITGNELAKGIDISTISCDYILLSHGHFDHVLDAEVIAKRTGATIVANFEIASYYGNKGLSYHPMNLGGKWNFGQFTVKAVAAVHSSVLADGTYGGNPMGYVIVAGDTSFYYSGDTALHMDMQLIPRFTKLNAAFLCMGDNLTMGVEDAIIASDFIQCNNIVAMHFDTFPIIKLQPDNAVKQFEQNGKQLTVPAIGNTYEL
ncbi:MAG TPA: metal-dependent hydrolase [Flavobacteriales bacterium]